MKDLNKATNPNQIANYIPFKIKNRNRGKYC